MSIEQDFHRLEERLDNTQKVVAETQYEVQEITRAAKYTLEENAYLKFGTRSLFAKLLVSLCIVFATGVYILVKKPERALDERVHIMTTHKPPVTIVQDPYVNFSRYGDKIVGWTLSLFTPMFGAYMIWDKRRRPR